jgi:hypothetical protein
MKKHTRIYISGLFNSPATEFTKVSIPMTAYRDLHREAIKALENKAGKAIIQVDVDEYILVVTIEISVDPKYTTGGSYDYGDPEILTVSKIDVEVLDWYMIDADCAGVDCDFESDKFERMF